MFEGRYLAGERMATGITYDENGEAPVVISEYLDPVSLLDMSYEDACAELAKAGISCLQLHRLTECCCLSTQRCGQCHL